LYLHGIKSFSLLCKLYRRCWPSQSELIDLRATNLTTVWV
jgi:hypothetical protein